MAPATDPAPYDALLLVSFGGPEGPEDVLPFLERVTRGRGIPPERLVEVGAHYHRFGGRSPINDQCRALLAAIGEDLAAHGIDLPVYWGNRNWDPLLDDVVAQMAADGVRRAACFVTSAYSSYSGCRQYRENLFDAVSAVPATVDAPRLDRLRHYFNHPGFVEPFVDSTVAALAELPAEATEHARLVFVTHSIPDTMAAASGRSAAAGTPGDAYVRQHRDVMAQVVAGVAAATGVPREADLVYCSRSGPPQMPWLEPDVNDHLEQLSADGVPGVVVVPIGFVSDHMEVVFDLDTEAAETAERLGLPFARAATPGADPRFAAVARDLLVERAAAERGEPLERAAEGSLPAWWDVCPPGCCANARQPDRPALCGADSPPVAKRSTS
jgi:ferrochelatase